jgi:hypothetical protein
MRNQLRANLLAAVGYWGRQTPEQLMAHLREAPAGLTGPAGWWSRIATMAASASCRPTTITLPGSRQQAAPQP